MAWTMLLLGLLITAQVRAGTLHPWGTSTQGLRVLVSITTPVSLLFLLGVDAQTVAQVLSIRIHHIWHSLWRSGEDVVYIILEPPGIL